LRNALSAFEFAQRVIQAKNIAEFAKLVGDFVNPQMRVLTEQWKDLSETFSKVAIDSIDISKTNKLSS